MIFVLVHAPFANENELLQQSAPNLEEMSTTLSLNEFTGSS